MGKYGKCGGEQKPNTCGKILRIGLLVSTELCVAGAFQRVSCGRTRTVQSNRQIQKRFGHRASSGLRAAPRMRIGEPIRCRGS
eukprot:6392059-Pyramimonas_sp.AAC.1